MVCPGYASITKNSIASVFGEIKEVLILLIDRVLLTGSFPEELKVAKIIPIFKRGSNDSMTNYWTISLLIIFSKIVEKVMKERLISYINNTATFDQYQCWFQSASGTESDVVDIIENVKRELNKNRYVVGVFIDLKKAFDTVDTGIFLCANAEEIGLRGVAAELIWSYVSNWMHYTYINGESSNGRTLNMAVPQGSVLELLLYLITICIWWYSITLLWYKYGWTGN